MALDHNLILNGTDGAVFLEGELLTDATGINAKMNFTFEDVRVMGSDDILPKFNGRKGEGSLTLYKVNSRLIKAQQDFMKTGIAPKFTIMTKIKTKDGKNIETIQIMDVIFTDVTLAQFNAAENASIEAPFVFRGYEPVDMI